MATILIVDDNAINRAFLVTLLAYGKHTMLEASDGAEGLKAMQAERPDLVISDILMPHMDGHEFAARIQANPAIAGTPVIFYTAGHHEAEARLIAQTCGVTRVLAKPAEPELILRTVHEVLGLPFQEIVLPALTAPPAEGSRFSTIDNQLAEYLVELERSSLLIEQLAAQPDSGDALAPQRALATKRLSASLVNLQAASERLASLMQINRDLAVEAQTPQDQGTDAFQAAPLPSMRRATAANDGTEPIMIDGPKVSRERARFQARLAKALQFAGYVHDSPTQLAREFNFRFTGKPVTIHAARKWLVGESIPTQDKLRILAQWLGVTAEWLRFGDTEQIAVAKPARQAPAASSIEGRLLADLAALDPYDRRLAHDFVSMLAQKHAQASAAKRSGRPLASDESIGLD